MKENNRENFINIEDKLTEIFGNINMWLQHAEAKNAAIFAATGAFIFSFLNYKNDLNILIFFLLNFLLISSLICSLISFYPNLSNSKVEPISKIFLFIPKLFDKKNKFIHKKSNIKIFYLDIANNYNFDNSKTYVIDFYKAYVNKSILEKDVTELENDYAKEIIINSHIAVAKYNYFKCSLILLGLFICFSFLSLSIAEIFNKKNETIIQNNLIMRNLPDINSEKIGKLNKKDKIIKLYEKENWVKVKFNNKTGWIYKIYLDEN